MDWIGTILDSIREMECPCCGARLASCAVRGITAEPNGLVVRVLCAVCRENSLAVVKRDQAADTPISRDEVLDVHDFLKGWHGRVTEVLAPGPHKEREVSNMANIKKDIVVDVPVEVAYDQWTQFESFPQFMEGVKEVVQLDEKTLRWHAEIGPKDEEWEAQITEQTPNTIIAWRSTTGAPNAGTVRFEPVDGGKTKIFLEISYEPRDAAEKVGDALGVLERRVSGDLGRFKEFIEKRQIPTGAWRGEIHGGRVEPRGDGTTSSNKT